MRFNYEVRCVVARRPSSLLCAKPALFPVHSPPPPPPAGLTLYQVLSEQDPQGFEIARAKLEELLPTLNYVATSSVGASVGHFLADV